MGSSFDIFQMDIENAAGEFSDHPGRVLAGDDRVPEIQVDP